MSFGGFSQSFSGLDASNSYAAESFLIDGSNITGALTALSFSGTTDPFLGSGWNLDDVSVTSVGGPGGVPEPATWGLMLTGFFA